jgi:hypothetical protein
MKDAIDAFGVGPILLFLTVDSNDSKEDASTFKGHIYVRQADEYSRSIMEIAKYVGRTYKYGIDIRLSIEKITTIKFEFPDDPPTGITWTEIKLWE